MDNNNYDCQNSIDGINALVFKAIKEINTAKNRAISAEKMLERFKEVAGEEIKRAYMEGYRKGITTSSENVDGGRTENKNDEKKLVLYNNN